LDEMRRAADSLNIQLRVWQNPDAPALTANLRDAANTRMQALFVTSGTAQAVPVAVAQIARFCEVRQLPTMCDIAGLFFQTGGVLAYSVDIAELGIRGASFVDRILRGANPAELPIEQPTRFQLIVNARRAKALGIAVPSPLLTRADRIIE
jgi:putative tryptophan/tyrosine transport system substrate-binding protein